MLASLTVYVWIVSCKRDIGKQCRTRSDATECCIWSGFLLFVYTGIFIQNGIKKIHHLINDKWTCPVNMSLVRKKPVFGVCNQGRLKLACASTEAWQRLEISSIETIGIILSRQLTKALIRLGRCAGWSATLLFAYGIAGFLMTWTNLFVVFR